MRRGGTWLAVAVAAIGVTAAVVAAFRWETSREFVAGVPLPAGSRVVESPDTAVGVGEPCLVVVETRDLPVEVMDRWAPALTARGWERVETEAARIVFRRPDQRLLVGMLELADDRPRTRLRLTLRPCLRTRGAPGEGA